MSPALKNLIVPEIGRALRDYVAGDRSQGCVDELLDYGIFLPIEIVERQDSRAACRECGETIPAGVRAIKFGLDPYAAEGRWGRLAAAYIHAGECPREENA